MKKKLLRHLAAIKEALGPDTHQHLESSFSTLKDAIMDMPEEASNTQSKNQLETELKTEGEFAIPMDLLGVTNAYVLYSDGACRGNPGPGAYGCILQDSNANIIFEHAQTKQMTTNNQMELEGVISGLTLLKNDEHIQLGKIQLRVITDSRYVVDGITKWIHGWKKRGWKKADNKVPENLNLWQTLDALVQEVGKIDFEWVKGHAGHPQNEYCDQLANQALDRKGF